MSMPTNARASGNLCAICRNLPIGSNACRLSFVRATGCAPRTPLHPPARWLYRSNEHLGNSLGTRLLGPLTRPLRRWDQAAARRADLYVANSEQVRARIRRLYGRDAQVVYPPVDVERFSPRERGERLL